MMKVKKFFFVLVFLIIFFVIFMFVEESEKDGEVVVEVVEIFEEVEFVEEGDEIEVIFEGGSVEEVKEEDDVLVLMIKIFDFVVKKNDIVFVEFYVLWFVELILILCDLICLLWFIFVVCKF